jgi:hypothetical protein
VERPVVSEETMAKERVRLATEKVADQETVTGEVRKEQTPATARAADNAGPTRLTASSATDA